MLRIDFSSICDLFKSNDIPIGIQVWFLTYALGKSFIVIKVPCTDLRRKESIFYITFTNINNFSWYFWIKLRFEDKYIIKYKDVSRLNKTWFNNETELIWRRMNLKYLSDIVRFINAGKIILIIEVISWFPDSGSWVSWLVVLFRGKKWIIKKIREMLSGAYKIWTL